MRYSLFLLLLATGPALAESGDIVLRYNVSTFPNGCGATGEEREYTKAQLPLIERQRLSQAKLRLSYYLRYAACEGAPQQIVAYRERTYAVCHDSLRGLSELKLEVRHSCREQP